MHRNTNVVRKKAQMSQAAGRATEEVVFADEHAKVAWEIGQAVSRITASLPSEGQSLQAQTITFAPADLSRGTYALFFSGTVIGTDRKDVFLVPERSLKVLDELEIPYQPI